MRTAVERVGLRVILWLGLILTLGVILLSLGASFSLQDRADPPAPRFVNSAARSRAELPAQACAGKEVGAVCSFVAGEQTTRGICAKAAAPGSMFCFRASESRLRLSQRR